MATFGTSVTIAQLASFFQVGQSTDEIFSDSVLSNKVNKWSIHKPIDYPQNAPLSHAQFKGTKEQNGDGIIYGLRAGAALQRPEELHSANWEYVGKPKGIIGTSPRRVDDFWGYEYEYDGPTLKGYGLVDGERIRYDTDNKVVNLIWRRDLTTVVDLAEVISAYQGSADYSKIYLCVMVGSYIRCCINNTAGGIYPILHNNTYCTSFTIPAVSPVYGYNEDTLRPVTLFFANETALTLTPAMKTEWVNPFGLNFSHPLISCPEQVNKQIYFVRQTMQYIAAFSISESRGSISMSIEKGSNWDNASAYRVAWSIKDTSGTNYPLRDRQYTAIDKALEFVPFTLVSDLMADASILAGNKQYNITAQMQYQTGGVWQASEFSSTVTVTY